MNFNPLELDQPAIYRLLTGTVIPRPIGWISSASEDGLLNLAPFSFFNVIGDDPPHVMFSTVRTGIHKDTLQNVMATKQFVVNMVTEETVEQMNATSARVAPDINEFEIAGLTPVPALIVQPPLVKESPVNFECELVHHYTLENHKYGGATIMIGKIVMFHIHESILLDDFKINLNIYKPVARLAGANYSKMGEIFSIKRA